jgi:DNA polymerase I-like protein with 3'-5' exonuclease and polymerase domains
MHTPHFLLQPYVVCVNKHTAGSPPVQLLAQIHDELLFEVPEAYVTATAAAVRHVMEGASMRQSHARTIAAQHCCIDM